jgi:hypothetical protein
MKFLPRPRFGLSADAPRLPCVPKSLFWSPLGRARGVSPAYLERGHPVKFHMQRFTRRSTPAPFFIENLDATVSVTIRPPLANAGFIAFSVV